MGKSKNSASIQLAFAKIQKAIDKLGKNLDWLCLVITAKTMATRTVGTAMMSPILRQVINQHKSLISHKGICAISRIKITFFDFIAN